MVEALRVKEQEINRKLVNMKATWDLEKAEIQAKVMEKDTELSALSNKLQVSNTHSRLNQTRLICTNHS